MEGQAPGVSTEAAREIRELRRKVSELERTIEILTAATNFLAREHDPLRRRSARPSMLSGTVSGHADLLCPGRAGHHDRPADALGAPVPAAVAADTALTEILACGGEGCRPREVHGGVADADQSARAAYCESWLIVPF